MGSSPVRLVPHKKRRLGHRPAQREDHVKTRGEDGRLQTLDKGLGRNHVFRVTEHKRSRAMTGCEFRALQLSPTPLPLLPADWLPVRMLRTGPAQTRKLVG